MYVHGNSIHKTLLREVIASSSNSQFSPFKGQDNLVIRHEGGLTAVQCNPHTLLYTCHKQYNTSLTDKTIIYMCTCTSNLNMYINIQNAFFFYSYKYGFNKNKVFYSYNPI